MHALERIPEGGCILADEVGLGKTIEAGLVMAQLLAEGYSRILIVLPSPLLGQWQDELFTLFDIEAKEAADDRVDIESPGVYLAGREYAGGPRGYEKLSAGPPFDLVLIDEAHEVFAGIHRRYDALGIYQEDSPHSSTAHHVRELIGPAPVLLMTATPIQNSLAELWALVQYVEPTQTLLGDLPTFKKLFCEGKDARQLADGQDGELRRRLSGVVKRTLRRQAQEFLEQPFVGRRAQLFKYKMHPEELRLYNDVTAYLLQPDLCAFRGRSRQLLLLGFHRLLASSTAALAKSLVRVAARLKKQLHGAAEDGADETGRAFMDDLEDDEQIEPDSDADVASPAAIQAELDRVLEFVQRAKDLPHDSKAESLLSVVRSLTDRSDGSDKVVVFTESLTTQNYLESLLLNKGGLRPHEVTLFRGVNDSARAREALKNWKAEVGANLPKHVSPSPKVAVRLALVHEFKTRSRVFISTEAGAKGLNLQFCDTLVNYDLPWNPQRIEQRIGRCHRYGQTHDVTVINFLAQENEAQRLTFEILVTKLDLFGRVLDMSDAVLHEPKSDKSDELAVALGPDFEKQLRRIWDRARTIEEVEEELRQLSDQLEDRRLEIERSREQTVGLIETRLDASVREVFGRIRDELPETLTELDHELERVTTSYLDAAEIPHERADVEHRRVITVGAAAVLPEALQDGLRVSLGHVEALADTDSLHGSHPLVEAAVEEARANGQGSFRVRFQVPDDAPEELLSRRGTRGRLALTRIQHRGFEREDRLVVTAVFEGAEVLRPEKVARELLCLPCEDVPAFDPPLALTLEDLDEVVDEELFFDHSNIEQSESRSFDRAIGQIEQFVEDRLLILRRAHADTCDRLLKAEQARDAALGSDARSDAEKKAQRLEAQVDGLDADIQRLEARQDPAYCKWKERAHSRRYGRPETQRLLDAEFVLE